MPVSSWPGQQDIFPGAPYTDFTEFIDAGYANSWIAALLALEVGIGTGLSGINAPLYSTVYNETFSSVAARIANLEGQVAAIPTVDESPSDYQPVGATAGVVPKYRPPDAGHIHQGVTSFDGRYGVVELELADIFALFTAKGQLIVGTGNGTGELLPPPNPEVGQVLAATANSTDPSGLQWEVSVWSPGDVKFTMATTVQTGWLPANGQAVSRSTYNNLLAACTIGPFNGTVTGNTINGLTSALTAQLGVGMNIEWSGSELDGIQTITGVGATSITVSGTPPTGAGMFLVFPYGDGDGQTTFNVINLNGRVPLGTGQGPLTMRYQGQTGGAEQIVQTQGQLASHGHFINDPGHDHAGLTGVDDPTHQHGFSGVSLAGYDNNYPGQTNVGNYGAPTTAGYPVYSNDPPSAGVVPLSFFPAVGQPGTGPGSEPGLHGPGGGTYTNVEDQQHFHGFTSDTNVTSINVVQEGDSEAMNLMNPFAVGQFLVKY